MKNFFLGLSGFLFGIIAVLHLVRFIQKWPVAIGSIAVPDVASIWACGIFALLALGCFVARSR